MPEVLVPRTEGATAAAGRSVACHGGQNGRAGTAVPLGDKIKSRTDSTRRAGGQQTLNGGQGAEERMARVQSGRDARRLETK